MLLMNRTGRGGPFPQRGNGESSVWGLLSSGISKLGHGAGGWGLFMMSDFT